MASTDSCDGQVFSFLFCFSEVRISAGHRKVSFLAGSRTNTPCVDLVTAAL